jgi:hypothetical protein
VWIVDVEVGVDALTGLPSCLSNAFAARRGFPAMVARKSRTCRYFSASFALSSRAWACCAVMSACPTGGVGGGFDSRSWGASPSPAPSAPSACSSMATTKHSRAGS